MSDLILFQTALREYLSAKRLAVAVAVVLLPSLLAVLWKYGSNDSAFNPNLAYDALALGLIFGFILIIMSMLAGTSVVSHEMERKSIVYLLTRPVPRARILLARFLGMLVPAALITCLSAFALAAVCFGPRNLAGAPLMRDLGVLLIGAFAYGSLALLLGTLLRKAIMYAIYFAFGWENTVSNLPGSFRKISIITYLKVLAPHSSTPIGGSDLAEILQSLRPPGSITPHTAGWVLFAVTVAAVVLAALVFTFREYSPRDDAV
ncbi:MAG: ABC transporter permease [Armatimonadota bacterium]